MEIIFMYGHVPKFISLSIILTKGNNASKTNHIADNVCRQFGHSQIQQFLPPAFRKSSKSKNIN
jgi:hypothetical protein